MWRHVTVIIQLEQPVRRPQQWRPRLRRNVVQELTTMHGFVVIEFTYKLHLGLLNTIT